MFFSKGLLTATYINGKPGKLTEAHDKAEHHPFKKEFLFKDAAIPKDIYVSRLIQQFLIIKAIETRLQQLSEAQQSELNAFFTLTYLQHLWRTPAMQQDLQLLGVSSETIHAKQIAKTTGTYLRQIETLSPKQLLAHFLTHTAGFMHGGAVITSKYIKPSNALTSYQIPVNQYDFSTARALTPPNKSVYQDLMSQVDTIELSDAEYNDIHEQCQGIYSTMSGIYDDLCDMHRRISSVSLTKISLAILALALVLKLLVDALSPMESQSAYRPA